MLAERNSLVVVVYIRSDTHCQSLISATMECGDESEGVAVLVRECVILCVCVCLCICVYICARVVRARVCVSVCSCSFS